MIPSSAPCHASSVFFEPVYVVSDSNLNVSPALKETVVRAGPNISSGTSGNDSLAQQLGYKDYADAISSLTAPPQSTTDFYNSAYSAAGLDALQNKITSRQNDLAAASGNINDNPWLDETSRVGQTRNLQTLANADIANWQN